MENKELIKEYLIESKEYLIEEIIRLNNELNKTNDELSDWKEYTQKILRLLKTFRNDYVLTQTKCIQNIENSNEHNVDGFNEFLRGKLHTITEIINDIQIIHSIKFTDDTNYQVDNQDRDVYVDDGVEEKKITLNIQNH